VIAGGQRYNTKAFARAQTSSNTILPKQDQLESLVDIDFDSFTLAKTLSTTEIVPTNCYEKDLQCSREI